MTSIIIIVILLLLQTCLNALSDSIIHHDSYINYGYFFSKDAAEARKKNWIHKYFPMFHDFWHLSKVLQTVCTMGVAYIATGSIVVIVILLFFRGLLFNIVYK
jgi:hypothetical protein